MLIATRKPASQSSCSILAKVQAQSVIRPTTFREDRRSNFGKEIAVTFGY
jgi:hypothetical protein